jgi:hypothetical protein
LDVGIDSALSTAILQTGFSARIVNEERRLQKSLACPGIRIGLQIEHPPEEHNAIGIADRVYECLLQPCLDGIAAAMVLGGVLRDGSSILLPIH